LWALTPLLASSARRFARGVPPRVRSGTRAFPALYPLSFEGMIPSLVEGMKKKRSRALWSLKKAIDRAGGALAFFGRRRTDDRRRMVSSDSSNRCLTL
jgi:hypothetical protein